MSINQHHHKYFIFYYQKLLKTFSIVFFVPFFMKLTFLSQDIDFFVKLAFSLISNLNLSYFNQINLFSLINHFMFI